MGEQQADLTRSGLERLVRHGLAAQIGAAVVGEIAVDDRFDELGVDSMKIVLVLAGLERDLAVERITVAERSPRTQTVIALLTPVVMINVHSARCDAIAFTAESERPRVIPSSG